LYPETPGKEKTGLLTGVFRALGFGRPKEPRAPAKQTRVIVQEKRRKPLFDKAEKEGK